MEQGARFSVDGLDCAEEVLLLKRALQGAAGISSLDFDIVGACMIVTFDNDVTSTESVRELAARSGLTVTLWSKRNEDRPVSWWQSNGRVCLTTLSGILLAAAFAVHVASAKTFAAAFGLDAMGGPETYPLAAKLLYGASVAAGVWFVLSKAWASFRHLRPDMNSLMSLAVVGAMLIGEWLEAATVSFLFALSLLLEHWSIRRTRKAISRLLDLSPTTAQCRDSASDKIDTRPVEEVISGTVVVVRPHEKIPLDGIVRVGMSSVDESTITGESVPVEKEPGSEVFAGTMNSDSVLEFEVTREAGDTTLARIVQMVEDAQSRRAPSEQWVETFALKYTPTMMGLAIAVALVPPLFFSGGWVDWAYRALVLLVIACPCALVISTPVSIVSALASAARHGVLVKGGRYLEAAAHVKAIALDKTGTLTRGQPIVSRVVPFNGHTSQEVMERAAAMEAHSQHPLARALLEYAENCGISPGNVENYRVLSGRGAEADFSGRPFWIGSHRLMHEVGAETPEIHESALELENSGNTILAVGNEDHVCGLIGVVDEVRSGAANTVAALRSAGVNCIRMLTGDTEQTAANIARLVGIDDYRSGLLPEDKVREVEALRSEFQTVAMVGDGVNDAPAMAVSTLGVAMGAMGTDVAIETADIALMSDDLSKLPWLMTHAQRTLRVIKQNIAFALGLKLLFLALALVGAASLWMAILADTGASLLVIANGLRLLRA